MESWNCWPFGIYITSFLHLARYDFVSLGKEQRRFYLHSLNINHINGHSIGYSVSPLESDTHHYVHSKSKDQNENSINRGNV